MLNQIYQKYKQVIPVFVMLYFCCMTIIYSIQGVIEFSGNTYDFTLTIKHYAGCVAVAINFITFLFFRPYYKFILLMTLFLGLFNLLSFSALTMTFGFEIGGVGIRFQPTSFFIILVTLIINIKRV